MNKQAIFAHFSKILDNMLDNSLFFETYFQYPTSIENIYGSADDEIMTENLSIRFGATRGCIIDENYDYVVKFDVDEDDYGSVCSVEHSIYQAAKSRNLHQYFAEVEYIGSYTKTIMFYDLYQINREMDPCYDYDNIEFDKEFAEHEDSFGELHPVTISIPLYAYRKAKPHWGIMHKNADSQTYRNIANSIDSPMRERNLAVAIDFISEYGEEAYLELSEFMSEENINDLHSGNVGNIDGHFVFIDFAGYHSTFY